MSYALDEQVGAAVDRARTISSSGGHATSRVPPASATRTRSPSAQAVPPVPATRVANSIGPAVARDALHEPDASAAQPEVHEVRVLRAPGMVADVRQARGHGRELADRRSDLIDDVRRVRAEPSAALRGVAPPAAEPRRRDRRAAGCGAGRSPGAARRSRRAHDRPGEQRLARGETELGAEEVHDPGASRPRPRACAPRPCRGRTASRTRRACPRRPLRARARHACAAASRSSPRRRPAPRARRRGSCTRSGSRSARPARPSWPDRGRPGPATSKPAARSARTCVRQPNPVPTTADADASRGDTGRVRHHRQHRVLADDEQDLDQRRRVVVLGQHRPGRVVDVVVPVQLVGGPQQRPLGVGPAAVVDRLCATRAISASVSPAARAYSACSTHSNSESQLDAARNARSSWSRCESTPFKASAAAQPRNGLSRSGWRASTAIVRAGSLPGGAMRVSISFASPRSSSGRGTVIRSSWSVMAPRLPTGGCGPQGCAQTSRPRSRRPRCRPR